MSWSTWWSAWSSWWEGSRHHSSSTTEEPTTEEPAQTPAPPSEWPAKDGSSFSPFGPAWTAALADPRCVQPERISIPAPSVIDVDCGAAGAPPDPPDPPNSSVPIRIYERGPKKILKPLLSSNYDGSENWYFLSGIWTDLPYGEKQLIRSFHSIHLYNTGRSPVLFPVASFVRGYMMIELLIGTRDGPHNRAPKGRMAHLPGNSAYMRIPGMWHSYASPLNIES